MGVMLTSCFAVLLLSATSYAQTSTCDIPSVEIGQNTTLTCHYNEDVWILQQTIIIQHYMSSLDENLEIVLFSSTLNGILKYYTHPEYVLRNTNDVIQVEIPRVATKHAGRYVCLVVQSNNFDFEECSFTPQEPPDFRYKSVSTTHSDITTTPESGTMDQEYPNVIIFGVIAGIMIVIILLVTAVVYMKRVMFIQICKDHFYNCSKRSSKDVEKSIQAQINTTEQRSHIQYSEVKEQDKSSYDEVFGSTNDLHTDIMQTCIGDDHIKGTEEELALCQNVLQKKESKKIFQKGEEHRHKPSTGDVDLTEDAEHVISPPVL